MFVQITVPTILQHHNLKLFRRNNLVAFDDVRTVAVLHYGALVLEQPQPELSHEFATLVHYLFATHDLYGPQLQGGGVLAQVNLAEGALPKLLDQDVVVHCGTATTDGERYVYHSDNSSYINLPYNNDTPAHSCLYMTIFISIYGIT